MVEMDFSVADMPCLALHDLKSVLARCKPTENGLTAAADKNVPIAVSEPFLSRS
jgi:hypothetical protein